jgi:uncharacterized protein YjbK
VKLLSQEIEIEYKNLITKDQYETLMDQYDSLRHPIYKQVNHYFDTKNFSIKTLRAALRVRFKQNNYVLTLKQPHSTGLLETHQKLDNQEFTFLKEHGKIGAGEVSHQLSQLIGQTIPQLCYLGHLTTERTEIPLKEGLLVLDKSYYFDRVDYEIEFECEEATRGRIDFQQLIDSWGLSWIEPMNKIERFYKVKQLIDNE